MPLIPLILLVFAVALAAAASEDGELLRRALAGDPKARRRLVERLMPVVRARVRRGLARRFSRSASALEPADLVQEVWLTLMKDDARALRAWEPGRGATLGGYVGMIVEREVGNHLDRITALKRGGDQRRVDDDAALRGAPPDGDPERRAAARELLDHLSRHLEQALPEAGRLVLRLLYTDGRSPQEAARMMGTTPNAIYIWQHRIRKAARACVEATPG